MGVIHFVGSIFSVVVLREDGRDLVLHSTDYQPCAIASKLTLRSGIAMALGLITPVAVFALIDPRVLTNAQFMIVLVLGCAMIACIFMYVCSLLSPGQVKAVVFDRRNRKLVMEHQGSFASTSKEIDLDQISSVQMVHDYDQDGYGVTMPMIVLKSREGLALPEGTEDSHLQVLRSRLGLH